MDKIYTYYACSKNQNFGDMITPYILSKLGYESELNFNNGVILDGSILGASQPNHHIFGAGFMSVNDTCKSKHIHYVRGYLSKYLLSLQNVNVENVKIHIPAFCLKDFIPNKQPTMITGIAHHYIDYDGNGINVCNPVETVVNDILDYLNIITSSLHVYLVARLYKRGAVLIRTNNRIEGDGTKFVDAFSTFGESPKFFDVADSDGIRNEFERTFNNPIQCDNTEFLNDLKQYLNTL